MLREESNRPNFGESGVRICQYQLILMYIEYRLTSFKFYLQNEWEKRNVSERIDETQLGVGVCLSDL